MGRISTKENKNAYQVVRENKDLSRAQASELLESISEDRIVKIEGEKCLPHPDEVLVMADKYGEPNLCNYYCSNQCPIGEVYVPQIQSKELPSIILEMIASLNSMSKQKDRLIEISADGAVQDEELEDFIFIQEELERISITVEALQLWSEKMMATGKIDEEKYNQIRAKRNANK